jgi:ankyrin repeat protein
LKEIKADNEENSSLYFDHGLDVNLQFNTRASYEEKTPMHFAAEFGSVKVLLALISRGAGVDPLDLQQRTPLTLAIENNRFACARSLIELGSDIE